MEKEEARRPGGQEARRTREDERGRREMKLKQNNEKNKAGGREMKKDQQRRSDQTKQRCAPKHRANED